METLHAKDISKYDAELNNVSLLNGNSFTEEIMILLEKINVYCSEKGFMLILMLDQPNILSSNDEKYKTIKIEYKQFIKNYLCRCFKMVVQVHSNNNKPLNEYEKTKKMRKVITLQNTFSNDNCIQYFETLMNNTWQKENELKNVKKQI